MGWFLYQHHNRSWAKTFEAELPYILENWVTEDDRQKVEASVTKRFPLFEAIVNKSFKMNKYIGLSTYRHKHCVLMMTWHKDYLLWVKVPCSEPLLDMASVFCTYETKRHIVSSDNTPDVTTGERFIMQNHSFLYLNVTNIFHCQNSAILKSDILCDNVKNCTYGEDELICSQNFTNITIWNIVHNKLTSTLPKTRSPLISASSTEKKNVATDTENCIFDRRQRNSGKHLASCETFNCTRHFKCPEYFCVPWNHICDGVWDCPAGYDEDKCSKTARAGFFHCSNSVIHVLLHSVCNGIIDCPQMDDEEKCALHNTKCLSHCICVHFTIICNKIYEIYLTQQRTGLPYTVVTILNMRNPSSASAAVRLFSSCRHFKIEGTSYPIFCLPKETTVSLSFFSLTAIKDGISMLMDNCLESVPSLLHLNMSHNWISDLQCNAFRGNNKIQTIILTDNKLVELKSCTLASLHNLTAANFLNNSLLQIEVGLFSLVPTVIHVASYSFLFCCVERNVKCSFQSVYSCDNFLKTEAQTYLVFVEASLLFLLNFVMVFLLIVSAESTASATQLQKSTTKNYNRLSISILVSHLVCCVFLGILAGVNQYFDDTFALSTFRWRQSFLCHLICVIFVFYFHSNCGLIKNLTVARFCLTFYPLETTFKRSKTVNRTISLVLFLAISFSVASTTVVSSLNSSQIDGHLCLPFSPAFSPSGSVTSTFGIVSAFLVPVLFVCIVTKVKNQSKRIVSTKENKSKKLIQNATISSISHILSCLPISVLHFVALFKDSNSTEITA